MGTKTQAAKTAILAAFLCFEMKAASAQVSIQPASPKAQATVRVLVPAGVLGHPAVSIVQPGLTINDYDPRKTQVSMSGNKISVSVELSDNGFGAPAAPMDMPLGQLPAGTYQVEVSRRLPDGTSAGIAGSTTFTVSPRAPADALWNHSDLWWNPAESGWGLSITHHGSGVIFALWYVYGADGKATWYAIPEGQWRTPIEYRGPVYRTTSPALQGCSSSASTSCPPFDPAAVTSVLVGSAIIEFGQTDSNEAFLSTTIDGVNVRRTIRRFAF